MPGAVTLVLSMFGPVHGWTVLKQVPVVIEVLPP